MKLSEYDKPEGYPALKVQKARVRLLWDSGWWDGPIDGMAEFEGEPVWFCLAEEAEDERTGGWFRRFWMVRLTPEQLRREQNRHADFQRYVGTHFDYDAEGKRPAKNVHTKGMSGEFYEKYGEKDRDPGDLSQNEVVGWFEW